MSLSEQSAIEALKQKLLGLSNSSLKPNTDEDMVALAVKAEYVFGSINIDWDEKDHPRDPKTGEFIETPGGFIFGKAETAEFPLAKGKKQVELKPGDVAFKTPADNIVVSHADGSYSLHHGDTISPIPAGQISMLAQNVQAGKLQKVGENPGVKIEATDQAQAADKLAHPDQYGKTASSLTPDQTSTQSPQQQSAQQLATQVKAEIAAKKPVIKQATDDDLAVGNIVYKSKSPTAVAWEVSSVNQPFEEKIYTLKKPGTAGGKNNAAFAAKFLFVKEGDNESALDAAPKTDAKTPEQQGNDWDAIAQTPIKGTPKVENPDDVATNSEITNYPDLKPGKETFTAKQYAAFQAENDGKQIGTDKDGKPILSGHWVEADDGKPYLLHASPHGPGKVTAYRWVGTKLQASNLEKEDFFTAADFKQMTAIEDPTGKPYGQTVDANSVTAQNAKPKHGSLMTQAVTGSIPSTSTAYKKHVASAKNVILTDAPDGMEIVGHSYLYDQNSSVIKSGDWVEIEGKPVQVHASPNDGLIGVAKWVSTKQQASNNVYDFPESVLASAVKIEDPTGAPYTPFSQASKGAPKAEAPESAPEDPEADLNSEEPLQEWEKELLDPDYKKPEPAPEPPKVLFAGAYFTKEGGIWLNSGGQPVMLQAIKTALENKLNGTAKDAEVKSPDPEAPKPPSLTPEIKDVDFEIAEGDDGPFGIVLNDNEKLYGYNGKVYLFLALDDELYEFSEEDDFFASDALTGAEKNVIMNKGKLIADKTATKKGKATEEGIQAMSPGEMLYVTESYSGVVTGYVKNPDNSFTFTTAEGKKSAATYPEIDLLESFAWSKGANTFTYSFDKPTGFVLPEGAKEIKSVSAADGSSDNLQIDTAVLNAQAEGTILQTTSGMGSLSYHVKQADGSWAIMSPTNGTEWNTTNAPALTQSVVGGKNVSLLIAPNTPANNAILSTSKLHPIEKSVSDGIATWNYQNSKWVNADTGVEASSGTADNLDEQYEDLQALSTKVQAMETGDQIKVTKKATGADEIFEYDAENKAFKNLMTGANIPMTKMLDVLFKPHGAKFNYEVIPKVKEAPKTKKGHSVKFDASWHTDDTSTTLDIDGLQPGDLIFQVKGGDTYPIVKKGDQWYTALADNKTLVKVEDAGLSAGWAESVSKGPYSTPVQWEKADSVQEVDKSQADAKVDTSQAEGQQFVHPVSGVTFALKPGDKVHKHKTTENAYIIETTDPDNPINFFTTTGKAQKPKASQKNLKTGYAVTETWPGKKDIVAETLTPGTKATKSLLDSSSPGDQAVYNMASGKIYVYTKTDTGTWKQMNDPSSANSPGVQNLQLPSSVGSSWTVGLWPKGTYSPETPDANKSEWGSAENLGASPDSSPAPEPKKTVSPAKKPAVKKGKAVLPKSITLPNGENYDLKPGELAATVNHGDADFVVIANPTKYEYAKVYNAAGQTVTPYPIYTYTPAQLKKNLNGGTILAENKIVVDKIDYASTYDAAEFNEETYAGASAFIAESRTQMKSEGIAINYGGWIYGYHSYDQYGGKKWNDLDLDQKMELIAGYEQVTGKAVATLEKVVSWGPEKITKSDKTDLTKARSGFSLIHRVAILSREIADPDTDWAEDKFETELAHLKQKSQKPGMSLSGWLKDFYPLDDIHGVLSSANSQRKFKKTLTDLDFDPYNGTADEYDKFAKSKGVHHLAGLTESEQKTWVLSALNDPSVSTYEKNAVDLALAKAKTKLAVGALAASLAKNQEKNPNGASNQTDQALSQGVASQALLKAQYDWSSADSSNNYVLTNVGHDTYSFTRTVLWQVTLPIRSLRRWLTTLWSPVLLLRKARTSRTLLLTTSTLLTRTWKSSFLAITLAILTICR